MKYKIRIIESVKEKLNLGTGLEVFFIVENFLSRKEYVCSFCKGKILKNSFYFCSGIPFPSKEQITQGFLNKVKLNTHIKFCSLNCIESEFYRCYGSNLLIIREMK